LGVSYANTISDTSNKLTVTKLQKTKQGIVEGSFTIRVSNSTKSKTILLANGKFSTSFEE
jgi:AICAR transformylase/IMP cyclohydrolase PurH